MLVTLGHLVPWFLCPHPGGFLETRWEQHALVVMATDSDKPFLVLPGRGWQDFPVLEQKPKKQKPQDLWTSLFCGSSDRTSYLPVALEMAASVLPELKAVLTRWVCDMALGLQTPME